MSDLTPSDDKHQKRQEILDELWALVADPEHPGSVVVAALDKIAKIENAYAPIKIESKRKFANLADFYAKVVVPAHDFAADIKSEAAASTVPATTSTQVVDNEPDELDDNENDPDDFFP
jgi:hypothetical protein